MPSAPHPRRRHRVVMATALSAGLAAAAATTSAVLSPPPVPLPVWPQEFNAEFAETTWFGGDVQVTPGSVTYSWSNKVQVMRRGQSRLNPICNEVHENRSTPCHHFIVNESRFLFWPEEGECCLKCTSNCGVLSPEWVTAPEHHYTGRRVIGGASCDTFYIVGGTPDRFATRVQDGALCELYDGGASYTNDNPFQWSVVPASFNATIDPKSLQLPEACEHASHCN